LSNVQRPHISDLNINFVEDQADLLSLRSLLKHFNHWVIYLTQFSYGGHN